MRPTFVTLSCSEVYPLRASDSAIFDRYNIVDERDLRDAVAKTTAYVSTLPTTSTVVPLRAIEGAGR